MCARIQEYVAELLYRITEEVGDGEVGEGLGGDQHKACYCGSRVPRFVERMGEGLWVGGWGGEGGLSGWVLKVSWVIWCLSSWPATSSPDFSLIMQDAGETDLPPSNGCQHPRSSSFKMTWATTENKLVVRLSPCVAIHKHTVIGFYWDWSLYMTSILSLQFYW